MGPVTLLVADLDAQTAFYRDAVTLTVLDEGRDTVTLGRGSVPTVVLRHEPGLRHAPAGSAGLFHTAILFETPQALAAALNSLARRAPGSFTGSADHLVSTAFYATDPEGNGVELYGDRDRTTWSWTHGQVEMDTVYLDPNRFLAEHLTEQGADHPDDAELFGPTRIGHVHLSVGDVRTAADFYLGTLGFDQTSRMGDSALFVSAGGYHHHMAMNVWSSRGAGRRAPALGLGRVEIALPGSDELDRLGERLGNAGVPRADDGRTLSFDDPWGNRILATVPGRG
ncbi:VOC family protein [Mycetocola reblochoni]|nr:VOC family protein [Mycetocola reblochoni]